MKTVRQNTFETNSSSSHSLTLIHEPFVKEELYFTRDNEYVIARDSFGWEFEKFNDADKKITYLAIYALDYDNTTLKDWLEEIIKEEGAERIIWHINLKNREDTNVYDCYIDHCGEADNLSDVISSKENVRNFILNKKSWLFLGNDNSTPHPDFYKTYDEIKDSTHYISVYDKSYLSFADGSGCFHYNFVENDEKFKETIKQFFNTFKVYESMVFTDIKNIEVKENKVYIKWDKRKYNYNNKDYTTELIEQGTTTYYIYKN